MEGYANSNRYVLSGSTTIYIWGFTFNPFIYSVVFETAYWSFLITTSLSLVWGRFYLITAVKVKALVFVMGS